MMVKHNLRFIIHRGQIFQKEETVNRMRPQIFCFKIADIFHVIFLIQADIMKNSQHRIIHQFLLRMYLLIFQHLVQNISRDFSVIHNFAIDDTQRFSDDFINVFAADDAHYLFLSILSFIPIPFLPIIIYIGKFCILILKIFIPLPPAQYRCSHHNTGAAGNGNSLPRSCRYN